MVAMLFHTALIGSVFFCLAALPNLQGFSPSPLDMGLMLLLGALATLGHFLFTAAYREAPASLLAPVNYLHLAWAGGLGWLVFDHVPDWLSTGGMALVCLGGVAAAVQAQFRNKGAKA
jgi:drug/metabolite transporter (DMT)-like permease